MLISITGKLINVQTGDFNSLVFQGTKWDAGLQKEVEASQSVMIAKDHMYLVEEYTKSKGLTISIPVRVGVTKKGGLWFSTSGNGKHHVNQPIAPKFA